ncbi:signal peptidase I [Aquisediminimonas sediminicola]|uniref:signal peptidase I n=1 Tax=Alteraquisediminimonas sediminicola TaxID=2676787 RepID=UPI001C8E65FA|nr:signal peptidase I [Aquisediminimonas sediminicola]
MTENASIPPEKPSPAAQKEGWRENLRFFGTVLLIAFVIRSLVFGLFNIPSESMLPRLLVGDYLLVSKWPYGYSRHSFVFGLIQFDGRILAQEPQRGDVVVFRAPPENKVDYIKRLIGLPGDVVEIRSGQVILNGKPVPRVPMDDFLKPISANSQCEPQPFLNTPVAEILPDGHEVCRYRRFRETLPNGKSYAVLDLGDIAKDNVAPTVVPEGHYFMMGDNRDNSLDSRFSPDEGGIGMVPEENLIGRAAFTYFSTDGSANWLLPWTWLGAMRPSRIGEGF